CRMVSEARGFNEGNAMTKVRTTFLFVAGFALGAWASLGINDTARTADQPANSPTSSPPAASSANPAPGGQGATTGGAPASPGAAQPQAGQPAGQPQAGGGRSGLSRRWWQSAGHRQERRERIAQEPVSGLQESRRGRSPEIHVGWL